MGRHPRPVGRPPKDNPLMDRQKFMAKHWDVLQDALLCGMTVPVIARKRNMSTDRIRIIIRESWALNITSADVRKYMERG